MDNLPSRSGSPPPRKGPANGPGDGLIASLRRPTPSRDAIEAAAAFTAPARRAEGWSQRIAAHIAVVQSRWPEPDVDDRTGAAADAWLIDGLGDYPLWAVEEACRRLFWFRFAPRPHEYREACDAAMAPLREALRIANRRLQEADDREAEEDLRRTMPSPEQRRRIVEETRAALGGIQDRAKRG